jgi:hypothetical protein
MGMQIFLTIVLFGIAITCFIGGYFINKKG